MIKITVNGKELVLFKDTTISMELHNPIFATDTIEGDVVFSFDIPISGNELTLETGHNIHVAQVKSYSCILLFKGIQIAAGMLYIQKITHLRMTVGIVVNPFPEGFASRSIRANESEKITISTSYVSHKEAFKQFLQASTDPDSAFKFAPFLNETGYGSANEDFGFWKGVSIGKQVNRLFFRSDRTPIASAQKPFIRIFPEVNTVESDETIVSEYNQVCFCPQIQLQYILNNIVKAAGYTLVGDVSRIDDFRKLYVQSGRALDAPNTQFEDSIEYSLRATGRLYSWVISGTADSDENGMLQGGYLVRFPVAGYYEIHFWSDFEYNNYELESFLYGSELYFTIQLGNTEYIKVLLGRAVEGLNEISFNQTVYIPPQYSDVGLYVGLMAVEEQTGYEKRSNIGAEISIRSIATEDGWLNAFAKEFVPAQYFPDVTNAEFLKSVCQSLGIALFVDANSKQIEMVPCVSVLDADSMDLTTYLVEDRTEIQIPEESAEAFKFVPLSDDGDVDELDGLFIGDVDTVEDLPDMYLNIGKTAFVRDRNAFYRPEKVEDETYNYRLEWRRCAGNTRRLVPEEGVVSEVTDSAIKIPGIALLQRDDIDRSSKLFCEIPFEIESYINNGGSPLSDLILLYYRGYEKFAKRTFSDTIYYEDMLPVKLDARSLTTTGTHSWGETYLKKWWKLYTRHRTVTYTFLLPLNKLIELISLIRPQNVSPSMQRRSIIVDHVKSFPISIKFELADSGDDVFAVVECATF